MLRYLLVSVLSRHMVSLQASQPCPRPGIKVSLNNASNGSTFALSTTGLSPLVHFLRSVGICNPLFFIYSLPLSRLGNQLKG